MQQEEEAYQQQRRRMYAEVHEEKERLAQQQSRQRVELDRLQRQLEEQTTNSSEAMRREYEKARDEQERRHEVSCKLFCWLQVSLDSNPIDTAQLHEHIHVVTFSTTRRLYIVLG